MGYRGKREQNVTKNGVCEIWVKTVLRCVYKQNRVGVCVTQAIPYASPVSSLFRQGREGESG